MAICQFSYVSGLSFPDLRCEPFPCFPKIRCCFEFLRYLGLFTQFSILSGLMFSSTSITSVAIHSCYSLSNQYISNHGLGLQPEPDPCSHLILVICLHVNIGQSPYTHHLHCYYLTQVNATSHSDYTAAPLSYLPDLTPCLFHIRTHRGPPQHA